MLVWGLAVEVPLGEQDWLLIMREGGYGCGHLADEKIVRLSQC